MSHDDDLLDPFGDELDLAETVARENPTADQLQHFANLRSAKHAKLNEEAPFIRNTPPSILNGSLGNQANVYLGNVGAGVTGTLLRGELIQVANWTGDDAETLPITVTLGRVNKTLPAKGTVYATRAPFAVLQWGTRGSLLSAEIDIALGCQLTLAASMITVQVGVEGFIATPSTAEEPIILSGMLSVHPIVRTDPITRTIIAVASGGVTSRLIPVFAKSLVIEKTSSGVACTIIFLTEAAGTAGTFLLAAGVQQLTPIEIPNDAIAFTITNDATGFDANARAIFNLAI